VGVFYLRSEGKYHPTNAPRRARYFFFGVVCATIQSDIVFIATGDIVSSMLPYSESTRFRGLEHVIESRELLSRDVLVATVLSAFSMTGKFCFAVDLNVERAIQCQHGTFTCRSAVAGSKARK
jgi:hypothetical protein